MRGYAPTACAAFCKASGLILFTIPEAEQQAPPQSEMCPQICPKSITGAGLVSIVLNTADASFFLSVTDENYYQVKL